MDYMDIKVNSIVTLYHYSLKKPIFTTVVEISNDIIVIKLIKEFSSSDIFSGDSIILIFESDNEICTSGCILMSINAKEGTVKLKVENFEFIVNLRYQDRFFVSLFADVKTKYPKNMSVVSVKNISLKGMMVSTKSDYTINQELEVDLYLEASVIQLNAHIAWKYQDHVTYKYGLITEYADNGSLPILEKYLQTLKDEYEEFKKKLKGL
jgi:hypothetical protein